MQEFGMQQKLTWNKPTFAIVLLSFLWNLALLIGVVVNAHFAFARAAGGQFTNFSIGIRIVYFLMSLLIVYQLWIFKLIFHTDPARPEWVVPIFFYLGLAGILMNGISRSSAERWNVIPAAIITWSFWYFGMKKNPDLT